MAQVAELNERLNSRTGSDPITATAIGMGGAPLLPTAASGLPDTAVLARVSWEGSPEFPDIHGHFADGPGGPTLCAPLHTAALNKLSDLLHVRQRWGIGPQTPDLNTA